MSRVEEALRRASGGGHALTTDPADKPAAADTGTLETYPHERPRIVERPLIAQAPPASKTIAAPRTTRPGQVRAFDPGLDGKLIGTPQMPHMVVEQYRRLAASLHESQVESGLKTLMVTSAMPQEGKTLTVTNLALTLSESYRRRVLLIDADLRRPSIHHVMRLPNTTGLSEALRSGRSRPPLLQVSSYLSVLPAGSPDADPMGALASESFGDLLKGWSEEFDWILLDAPPVGLMPDGSILARLTRAVIFVVAAGSTPHKLIDRAIAGLGKESIIGIVLNRIEERNLPAQAYYSGYYGAPPSK